MQRNDEKTKRDIKIIDYVILYTRKKDVARNRQENI